MSLSELSTLPGVSGDEGRVREAIAARIRDHVDHMWVDSMGNLYAVKGAHLPGPRLMLCAHMDEVGLIVTHIEENGLLRFDTVGGIDPRVLPGIWVQVGPDRHPGVIGTKPPHLKRDSERERPVPADNLFIDVGAASASEAERLVQPGAYASFWTEYEETGDGRAKGKAFDDRVGCHILIEVLRRPVNTPLFAAFTVQEEVGLRGATVAAFALQPDAAIVLEGTICADLPLSVPHGESTRLGGGPALTIADRTLIAHPGLVRSLVRVAEDAAIPFQWKRTTFGGTDGGAIHTAGSGIPTAVVSVPCRYLHTPASVLSLQDVADALRWIGAYVDSISPEGDPPWMRSSGH